MVLLAAGIIRVFEGISKIELAIKHQEWQAVTGESPEAPGGEAM